MVIKLTNIVTKRLNWFYVKFLSSLYYIPHVIMHVSLIGY